jgi:hypothetical protein
MGEGLPRRLKLATTVAWLSPGWSSEGGGTVKGVSQYWQVMVVPGGALVARLAPQLVQV